MTAEPRRGYCAPRPYVMSLKTSLSPQQFCSRAVAYVKGVVEDRPGDAPPVELSFDESMAMRPLCDGLIVNISRRRRRPL
jgi:hypothetical protein